MRGIGVCWAALAFVPLAAFAAERRPAAPQPAKPAPAAAAPAAPAGPGVPTNQREEMGYPSVEAAMHGLSQRPDLRVSAQGVWLNYDDPEHKLLWSFPVQGVAAYPSVIRRQVLTGPKGSEVKMTILCEAPQPACDAMAGEFLRLNGLMEQRLNAQGGPRPGGTVPGDAVPAAPKP